MVPWLDRSDVDISQLSPEQRQWREHGYVILPKIVPEPLLADYARWREERRLPDELDAMPGAYAYMFVPEIRRIALYKPVAEVMASLIGEPLALEFILSGWKSSERAWHQDDYLNDATVNGYYAAVWIAVDDIDPDAGPFEFVPGSNRWPVMRREKVKALLTPEQANSDLWPYHSQDFVARAFEAEIAGRGASVKPFLAKRGDALIWHARLLHRGSAPRNRALVRRSLICHYCGISKVRPEYHEVRRSPEGVPYIHHKLVKFEDWDPAKTGVRPFVPS
jgi:hypothetical protein